MSKERPSELHVYTLAKATASFYLREDDYGDVIEDSKTVNVRGNPEVIQFDFADVGFGLSAIDNSAFIHIRSKKNILVEKGLDKYRDFVEKDKDLEIPTQDLPLRIIDHATRDQVLIGPPSSDDEATVGVLPIRPLPTLEASVALEIPK